MKKIISATTKRKRDFVSLLAVFLFTAAIFLEFFVIYWLSATLNSERRWKKEVALEETIEKLDLLRANMTSLRTNRKDLAKEAGGIDIAKACLDDYAGYLRENGEALDGGQIDEIYSRLLEFEQLYEGWRSGEGYLKESDIEPSSFMQSQLRRL